MPSIPTPHTRTTHTHTHYCALLLTLSHRGLTVKFTRLTLLLPGVTHSLPASSVLRPGAICSLYHAWLVLMMPHNKKVTKSCVRISECVGVQEYLELFFFCVTTFHLTNYINMMHDFPKMLSIQPDKGEPFSAHHNSKTFMCCLSQHATDGVFAWLKV